MRLPQRHQARGWGWQNSQERTSQRYPVCGKAVCTRAHLPALRAPPPSAAPAVKDIRIAYDRATGEPRGFAFVHFYSVADATAALESLQGAAVEGQARTLRLGYARDLLAPADDAAAAAGGSEGVAIVPAVAAAYAGWEPKSLEEAEAEAAAAGSSQREPQSSAGGGQQEAEGDNPTAAAGAAPPMAPVANHPPGFSFSYDPTSGYMLDAASGYYYDANTGREGWGG